jgi:LytS/YehU family sensor histidine kinase
VENVRLWNDECVENVQLWIDECVGNVRRWGACVFGVIDSIVIGRLVGVVFGMMVVARNVVGSHQNSLSETLSQLLQVVAAGTVSARGGYYQKKEKEREWNEHCCSCREDKRVLQFLLVY